MRQPPPIRLTSGAEMPALGVGTWRMGEDRGAAENEVAALRRALDRGFCHIDTAEMYGEGGAEEILGRALAGQDRDALFLTSKFYPQNASAARMTAACERSLRRLGIDCLDLYLLHWPGATPFEETLEGAAQLKAAGKIRAFGVSNFDAQELAGLTERGLAAEIEVNQVLHNPSRRGIEFDLLPQMAASGIACMAYTPIEPRRMAANPGFAKIAAEEGLAPAELALAWHLTLGRTCPIPKAAQPRHLDGLARAAERRLSAETMAAIDRAFPPPAAPEPLEIL